LQPDGRRTAALSYFAIYKVNAALVLIEAHFEICANGIVAEIDSAPLNVEYPIWGISRDRGKNAAADTTVCRTGWKLVGPNVVIVGQDRIIELYTRQAKAGIFAAAADELDIAVGLEIRGAV